MSDRDGFSIAIDSKLRFGPLWRLMQEMGWNQKQAAAKIGVTHTQLNGVVCLRQAPTDRFLRKLSPFVGMSPSEMYPEWAKQAVKAGLPIRHSFREVDVSRPMLEGQGTPLMLPAQEQKVELGELKSHLDESMLDHLTPRQEQVVRLRFFEGMTLREVGEKMCIGQERVRQIEALALRKLRQSKLLQQHAKDEHLPGCGDSRVVK